MSIATGKGPPVWAIDVDGVLARFNEGALAWLNAHNAGNPSLQFDDLTGPTSWHWLREMFGRKAEDAFWTMVHKNPRWWYGLERYYDAQAFIDDIARRSRMHQIVPYFVTSRPPNDAQDSTRDWLEGYGFFGPSVIVVQPGKKHLVLEAIGAQVIVDDYTENFVNLPVYTRGYLVDRPWNRHVNVQSLYGVTRISSPLDVFAHETKYASGNLEGHR